MTTRRGGAAGRAGPRQSGGLPGLALLAGALLATSSCRATTARPYYQPLPTAAVAEVELSIPDATRALSETMARDSIALAIIKEKDGYIDSGWLDATTLEHTTARPLGTDVVRVRAWVNPSKDFWSELVVEASYRVMDDPSRPERELDRELPDDHPLQRRLAEVIRKMIEQYGDADALKAAAKATPVPLPAKPDSARAKPDSAKSKARPDTLKAKIDTTKVKRDTTAAQTT